jgi:ABC-type Co2+ transport system permease subunit
VSGFLGRGGFVLGVLALTRGLGPILSSAADGSICAHVDPTGGSLLARVSEVGVASITSEGAAIGGGVTAAVAAVGVAAITPDVTSSGSITAGVTKVDRGDC